MQRGSLGRYAWFGRHWAVRPGDGEIRTLLLEQLREDPLTRRQPIAVRVQEGVVTLSGDVSSWQARRAADDDAWATPGVADVHNHLRVRLRPADPQGPRAA